MREQFARIGLALQNYHADHNCFPVCVTNKFVFGRPGSGVNQLLYSGTFAPHVRLLPYMELGSVCSSINFLLGSGTPELLGGMSVSAQGGEALASNATALALEYRSSFCPSDAGPFFEIGQ